MSLEKDDALKAEENRREFLQNAIAGITILLGGSFGLTSILTLAPREKWGRQESFIPLTEEENAPRRGVKEIPYSYTRGGREIESTLLLVQASEGLIALSPSCTHLGCFVVWKEEEGIFSCPCHGGTYDRLGRNIEGPPPRPLARFPLKVIDGFIHVKVPV